MSEQSRSVLVVTGEPSGEQHAGGVIEAFRKRHPAIPVHWFGSGGRRMEAAGAEVLFQVAELAAIGPWAALGNLASYVRLYRRLLREAKSRRPDLALLVDFPDFNLRLAPRLKALGIPVCYFIGPQVWAWRPSRVDQIRRHVDRMLVIFPFEENFYRSRGVPATYVGNPSASSLRFADRAGPVERGRPVIALMPGSRRKEIQQILPVQLEAAAGVNREIPCRFWVIRAEDVSRARLEEVCREWMDGPGEPLDLEVREGAVSKLLPQVDCAIIKSGTSTLEAMLLEVPFAMVYRMSNVSYRLLRPWVATDVYCLANWVAGERVVPEFVQDQAAGSKIAEYLLSLLRDRKSLDRVKQNLRNASEKLGQLDAHANTADQVARFLKDGRSI